MELYHPVKIDPLQLEGNIFLAPVAGYSNATFRSVCAKLGSAFEYTELVSSESLVRNNQKAQELLRKGNAEKHYAIQLFGGNPETMAQAAKSVLETYPCDCIDINVGCPMPKITGSGGGAHLMQDVPLLHSVAKAVVQAAASFNIPVTAKIRSGWDFAHLNWAECSTALIDAGVKAITLHPRTSTQRYAGKADWSLIAELVQLADGAVSVFGSGDLFTPEDAKAMLEQTNCDGIMFARGAMGNPFIFQQTKDLLCTGRYDHNISAQLRLQTFYDELAELAGAVGEHAACLQMRKKAAAGTKGFPNAASLRSRMVTCSTLDQYKSVIHAYLEAGDDSQRIENT